MGYHSITEAQKNFFQAIFSLVRIIEIDNNIINKAIELKQAKKMTTGDAIIAATALLNQHELITRNVDDFKHLASLHITNPINK